MKTQFVKTIVMVLLFGALASCKKDENNQPDNNQATMPTSIVATWEAAGANLPTQALRDKYSKIMFTVGFDDDYTMVYYEKNGSTTTFTGRVAFSGTSYKHSSGSPLTYITILVEKINGQSSPGGWKGMFAFEPGNVMKLNIEPNVSGVQGPDAGKGFGSGSGGAGSVYTYVKK